MFLNWWLHCAPVLRLEQCAHNSMNAYEFNRLCCAQDKTKLMLITQCVPVTGFKWSVFWLNFSLTQETRVQAAGGLGINNNDIKNYNEGKPHVFISSHWNQAATLGVWPLVWVPLCPLELFFKNNKIKAEAVMSVVKAQNKKTNLKWYSQLCFRKQVSSILSIQHHRPPFSSSVNIFNLLSNWRPVSV